LKVSFNLTLVISLLRQKLLEAGTNTIATLPKVFKSYQSCDPINQKVEIMDFFDGLQQYGIYLRKEEMNLIAKYFEKDCDGKMYYSEFLYAIRGKPNDERQAVIDLVYYKFDKNRTGTAEASELRKVFNCVKHPRYQMKDYTEDQIFYLYLQNFDNNPRGSVTKKVRNL
jgi:Ca2+-binding EF-hand superfamily protein